MLKSQLWRSFVTLGLRITKRVPNPVRHHHGSLPVMQSVTVSQTAVSPLPRHSPHHILLFSLYIQRVGAYILFSGRILLPDLPPELVLPWKEACLPGMCSNRWNLSIWEYYTFILDCIHLTNMCWALTECQTLVASVNWVLCNLILEHPMSSSLLNTHRTWQIAYVTWEETRHDMQNGPWD